MMAGDVKWRVSRGMGSTLDRYWIDLQMLSYASGKSYIEAESATETLRRLIAAVETNSHPPKVTRDAAAYVNALPLHAALAYDAVQAVTRGFRMDLETVKADGTLAAAKRFMVTFAEWEESNRDKESLLALLTEAYNAPKLVRLAADPIVEAAFTKALSCVMVAVALTEEL